MKAQVTVKVGEASYPVVVQYEDNSFVAEVKKAVVTELKETFDGFESVKAGHLTLKTLDGDVIMEEIPAGKKFLADLVIPDKRMICKYLLRLLNCL